MSTNTRYDEDMVATVAEITGLSGEQLEMVVGTVYATVFLGAFPGKDDLAAYLSCTTARVNELWKKISEEAAESRSAYWQWMGPEMILPRPGVAEYIYPIAAECIARGLFFGVGEESIERLMARTMLEAYLPSQTVKSKDLFIGYNILLEYLWQHVQGDEEDIDRFIEVRYQYFYHATKKLQKLCQLIVELNPHQFDLDSLEEDVYRQVSTALAKAACNGRDKAIANGSARIGKARLQVLVNLDRSLLDV